MQDHRSGFCIHCRILLINTPVKFDVWNLKRHKDRWLEECDWKGTKEQEGKKNFKNAFSECRSRKIRIGGNVQTAILSRDGWWCFPVSPAGLEIKFSSMCADNVSPSLLVRKCTTLLNGSSFLQQSDEFIGSFDFGWIFQNQNNNKKLFCVRVCVHVSTGT